MVRSADADTVAGAVALLLFVFGSAFAPVIVAVLFSVPLNVGLMFAVSVNCADAPLFRIGNMQLTMPLLPAPGFVQVAEGPLFWISELKVVPAGRVSMRTALDSGWPLFVTVIIQAIVAPAVAVPGPVFVIARSLLETVRLDGDTLLLVFGSTVAERTPALLLNSVPDAVPAGM